MYQLINTCVLFLWALIIHYVTFLSSDTYIVGVQAFCIGNSCVKETGFKAQVDSGTSFTFVPQEVYEKVSKEVLFFFFSFSFFL